MTLRQRLFLWYGGVLFVTGGCLCLVLYLIVAHKMRKEFYQFLTDEYLEAVQITNENLGNRRALKRAVLTEVKGVRYFPFVYRLYDLDKGEDVLMLATKKEWLQALPVVRIPQNEPDHTSVVSGEEGELVRLAKKWLNRGRDETKRRRSIFSADGEREEEIHFLTGYPNKKQHPHLLLQVGLSYERVHLCLSSLRHYLLATFFVAMALATVGGHLLASHGLKPVHQIAASLEQVDAGSISYRLPEPKAKDEIGRIVQSVNSMLGRLQEALQHQRDFTANAAHELRTPLTAAKCRLEVALERERGAGEYEEAIQDALDRLSGLNKLIEDLLFLANLDVRPDSYERQEVSLFDLLADITEFFGIVAEQKGINLRLACPSQCTATGNEALLRRLFSNLIENAISHTPPGGEIRVETSCTEGRCNIMVIDSGSGMDAKDLARIFQRFYRADDAGNWRKGAGLGLSICKKIVEVHGGLIRANSERGKGTSFNVHLPR